MMMSPGSGSDSGSGSGHGRGRDRGSGSGRGRGRGFRNFANALCQFITCANSLPSTSQQEQQPQQQQQDDENEENDENDPLMWSNDLKRHSCGEFSHAIVQSSNEMRTYSQVEVGSNAIFVGIYDGHMGHHAAEYLSRNLTTHFITNIREHGTLEPQVLNNAIQATDEAFLSHVQSAQETDKRVLLSGSSCLVGVIWKNQFFVASVGTSHVVKGRTSLHNHNNPEEVLPSPITDDEHNVNVISVREEVINEHQHDPHFVVLCGDDRWRIKGVTEISRSIGDAYLKRVEFKIPQTVKNFKLSSPLIEPGLSSQPFQSSTYIEATDRFFIFATHGFWAKMRKHKAVNIVSTRPREGIARRLLKIVLRKIARDAKITYNELVQIPKGERREIHNDISVIVVFLDHELVGVKDANLDQRSFKGFSDDDVIEASAFREIDELM